MLSIWPAPARATGRPHIPICLHERLCNVTWALPPLGSGCCGPLHASNFASVLHQVKLTNACLSLSYYGVSVFHFTGRNINLYPPHTLHHRQPDFSASQGQAQSRFVKLSLLAFLCCDLHVCRCASFQLMNQSAVFFFWRNLLCYRRKFQSFISNYILPVVTKWRKCELMRWL